jgi:hypothetical protein
MVAGGTIGVANDGTIIQCDNLRHPDPDKPYMRIFSPEGKYVRDLRKYCMLNSGLLGFADGQPILSWRKRYLLMLEGEYVAAQADLGGHFESVEANEIISDGENLYLLATDGAIYKLPIYDGWTTDSYSLDEVESAAEAFRNIMLVYISTYGSPPGEVDLEFWQLHESEDRIDGLLEFFFGDGPFDYRVNGRDDFSFKLFGRDSYQTIFQVTRDEVEALS